MTMYRTTEKVKENRLLWRVGGTGSEAQGPGQPSGSVQLSIHLSLAPPMFALQ